jgi:hypothetical protein
MRYVILLTSIIFSILSVSWSFDLEPIGVIHFGSAYQDVFIEGNYAYFATTWGLEIFELIEEGEPHKVGEVPTPGEAVEVDIRGGYAFIADGRRGLAIVDISDPTLPRLISSLDIPEYVWEVAASNGVVYVEVPTENDIGIGVVDVTDPANPKLVRTFRRPPSVEDIAVSGDLMLVTSREEGLVILDAKDPLNPVILSKLETPDIPDEFVVVSDKLALVTCGRNGVISVDISDPNSPRILSTTTTYDPAYDIAADGKLAFVGSGGNVMMIDMTDPENLKLASVISTEWCWEGRIRVGAPVEGVDAGKGWALAANLKSEPVVMRIEDGELKTVSLAKGRTRWPGTETGVAVSDGYAVITDEDEVMVINLENKSDPKIISSLTTFMGSGETRIYNGYAIMNMGFLWVIDISNPEKPSFVASGMYARDMEVRDDLLFTVGDKFRILDLKSLDMGNNILEEISALDLGGTDVEFNNGYAFVAGGIGGIAVLNVKNIRRVRRPKAIAQLKDIKADKIAIEGEYLFTAYRDELSVFDISDVKRPRLISSVKLDQRKGYVNDLEVYKMCLFVAELDGLSVFDFSDPAHPRLAAEFDTPMHATDVYVDGDTIYLTDAGDLFVFQAPWWKIIGITPKGNLITRYGTVKAEGMIKDEVRPAETVLLQNFPNPFNIETWIPFQLSEDADVSIVIYELSGRVVRRLELGYKQAGHHTVVKWDGRDESGREVASGVYFYTIRAGRFSGTGRMVMVK